MGGLRASSIATSKDAAQGTPEEARADFLSALHAGNRQAAVALLARDACFVTPDSTVIRGRSDIAPILAQMSAMRMELEAASLCGALIAGNTALSPERWTVRSGPGGELRTSLSRSVMVRVEGAWKLLIVAPWGWP